MLSPRTEHTYGTDTWLQNNYITRGQPQYFRMKPLFDVIDEAYTVYYTLH